MKNFKIYILFVLVIFLLLFSGVLYLLSIQKEKQMEINDNTINKIETKNNTTVYRWDAETASSKEYSSYDEMQKDVERERKLQTDQYLKSIQGTILEQVQKINIPSYQDDNELVQLQNGEIEIFNQENSLEWFASVEKNTKSFVINDFNKDGLDDVAHIIGYTGGGSGYFFNLFIFINNQGTLKYLTKKELGDRVFIKDLKYVSGNFLINMITQGEDGDFLGYCCPNIPKTVKFKLQNGKLEEI